MAKRAVPPLDAVPIAAPYRHKIGAVTFVVASFGNARATDTAQQMLLRLLEEKVRNRPVVRECA